MPKKITAVAKLIKKFSVDETFTKPVLKKSIKFDSVKDNTFPVHNYNYMMDLLHLPTTKQGFKYLLVAVDLWSDACDFERMKTNSSADC